MLRLPLYAEAAARLLAADQAYPCYCTPEELDADRKAQEAAKEAPRYVGRCATLTPDERAAREAQGRTSAIRFRVGTGVVAFDDIVRGHVEIDVSNLGGDFVIVRADGTPLYHFVVVVDDAAMEISHIIRGEDHLSNTPKHILLFRALGHPEPAFAHLPLILNPDRSKMSKRKSQTAVSDYIAEGFVREALVNYLALLGWATGTEEEVLSIDEIAERFELETVHKGGAVFDRERLEWLNGQWIRRLEPEDLIDRLRPFVEAELAAGRIDRMPSDEELRSLLPVITERLPRLGAIGDLVGFLWVDDLAIEPALLVPKRWDAATTSEGLVAARHAIADVGAVSFEADELEPPLRALAEARGWKVGDLFMAIRVAVTGRTATPPLFDTLVALGHDRTLERLDRAIEILSAG
jgi:glutamyl-tRNA synthetase